MSETMIERAVASEEARFAAMSANDLARLDGMLAPDLHYVHANGMVEDKTEFLRKISSGERRYQRFASRNREVRAEGSFTFIFGEAEVEVFTKVGLVKNTLAYTAVYRDTPVAELFAWHAVKAIA